MKVLYFDCFSGISGDMALGALMDLGVNEEIFRRELDKLKLKGYEIKIGKKIKNGIWGTDINVIVEGLDDGSQEGHHSLRPEDSQGHGHAESHHHGHVHPERGLKDIENIIDESGLNSRVKEFSKRVFYEIARAEAKVHNKDIYEVHFHEVGAVDSIVDIVGTAICIDLLGVGKVYSSPLHEGYGFIRCQHGMIPVPVPAVMEMLSGTRIPIKTEDINTELVTPTGMGIIKNLAADFGGMPSMFIEKIGYGMGKRETGRLNALRVVLGSTYDQDSLDDEIAVLETNIDDMSPEVLGYTMEKLLESGALDVFYTPIYMKKNRPAVMLTVLAAAGSEEALEDIVFKETSTLGIRRSIKKRHCLERKTVKVETEYGDVRVKVAGKGDFAKYSPEYEDCRQIAKKEGLPLSEVYRIVDGRYRQQ